MSGLKGKGRMRRGSGVEDAEGLGAGAAGLPLRGAGRAEARRAVPWEE